MSGSILKYFSPKSKESTPKRPSEATSSPLSVSSSLRPSNGSPLSSKRVFSPLLSSALSPSPSPKRLKVDSSAMTHPPSQLGLGGGERGGDSSQDYIHLNLAFLKDDKRKDAQGRRPGSPGYDPNTLYLPDSFLCGVTPAQRQWWSLKASNFSSLLFFKMGKFYEIFHMDALVVSQECEMSMMKGEIAHCGFPEVSFERYAEILISRGHSLIRIEQTETPEGLEKRLKVKTTNTKWEKVVKREICQKLSPGTRLGEKSHAESELLVALILHEGTLGFCSVDCSMGIIQIGQWKEEEQPTQAFSNTQLVLCQINPLEFLLEAEEKNQKLSSHLETRFPAVKRTLIQAPSPTDTIDKIIRAKYFSSVQDWPSVLKRLVRFEEESPLAREGLESSLMALGTVISFLSDSLIDYGILAQGKMEDFHASSSSSNRSQKIMILDDSSLYNLDVLPKGKKSHSLLGILDNTSTPIGRRLLKKWVTGPLFARSDILRRQEAIAELSGGSEPGSLSNNYLSDIKTLFKRLPDFERLTGIIACNGFGYPPGHPEHRAVYIDASLLSKKKLTKFLDCLNGFKAAHNGLKSLLGKHDFKSALLLKLLEEDYPLSKMNEVIRSFESSMDIPSAVKTGRIIPSAGMDPEYDEILEEKQSLEKECKDYISSLKKRFKSDLIKFFGNGKNAFQIEFPAVVKVGEDYEFTSRRKGFNRYATETSKSILDRHQKLEEREISTLNSSSSRIYAKFSSHSELWRKLINCIAVLDALMSLAHYSYFSIEGVFPQILPEGKRAFKYVEGVHPILQQIASDAYIPNELDMSDEPVMVLTGANMGGKSSLMRQSALLAVLAQIGVKVPAESMALSPIDRIFTRIGASDNIFGGESTFLVELSEMSRILSGMTEASFVLIDELGRGTTTYDGMSLAFSTLKHLSGLGAGRVMFSTHYHRIMAGAGDTPIYHMSFQEDGENEITFLYKLARGACPKSHGFNTARLAGIPSDVVENGMKASKEYERKEVVLDSLLDALIEVC